MGSHRDQSTPDAFPPKSPHATPSSPPPSHPPVASEQRSRLPYPLQTVPLPAVDVTEQTQRPVLSNEFLADNLTFLRDTYRAPDVTAAALADATTPKRRGPRPRAYPLSDAWFARAISAQFRVRHPDVDPERGKLETAYFQKLREGHKSNPRIEILQAIAEFFGVEVELLLSPRPALQAALLMSPAMSSEASASVMTPNERPDGADAQSPASLGPTTEPQEPQEPYVTHAASQAAPQLPAGRVISKQGHITVIYDHLPAPLDQLSPEQRAEVEADLAQAMRVVTNAMREFSPTAVPSEPHTRSESVPTPAPRSPRTARSSARTVIPPSNSPVSDDAAYADDIHGVHDAPTNARISAAHTAEDAEEPTTEGRHLSGTKRR